MKLSEFLARSSATPVFRDAVAAFQREHFSNDRVTYDGYSPAVKVERTLTMLLRQYPELAIDRVEISGSSGCEFYRGELRVFAGDEQRRVRFHWDCKWRAMQQGWTDYFGFPDQPRAAREFGYDCFRVWDEVEAVQPVATELPPVMA